MGRWIKRVATGCGALVLVVCIVGFAYMRALDLDSQPPAGARSTVADLDFMQAAVHGSGHSEHPVELPGPALQYRSTLLRGNAAARARQPG